MFDRSKEQLKAQLEERLRTALDFATLGAYAPEPTPHPDSPQAPQARVFLFAKVAPPCPHSPAPAGDCDAAGVEGVLHRVAGSGSVVGTRRRTRRQRRGGTAKAAPQPCTWAGAANR